jgi:iron(III) transport system substrate-binding protein
MKTKYRKKQMVFGFIFVCLVSFLTVAHAWGQSAHQAKLIEGAKKEGKLIWYTSMSALSVKPLLSKFLEDYPYLKVEFVHVSTGRIINRINTEGSAGKSLFDVVSANSLAVLGNQLSPYVSPEANAYPREIRDLDGRWTGFDYNYYILAYNTRMVSEKEIPKDYEDLLHSRWKGKISIDVGDYLWYGALVSTWGRSKADRYMRQLARQNIQLRSGHTLITQLIAAGESPLGFPYANTTERLKEQGAPVDWVDTLDPIVTGLNYIGISAKPNNPNAAQLFIDFILSKKGQEIVRSLGRLPVRADVKPIYPKADPTKLKLKQIPTEVYVNSKTYAQQFREIFNP